MDSHSKALFAEAFQPPIVFEPDFFTKPYSIARQLFVVLTDGKMFPRYPATSVIQKTVICEYVKTHGIRQEDMLMFWTEYVRCLLACYRFEEDSAVEFRAWAYGRLSRYVLLARPKT